MILEGYGETFTVKAKIKKGRTISYDPERIVSEYGAKELSKTKEGVKVLERNAKKYEKELIQPSDPRFEKEWGKEVRQRNEEMREVRRESDRQWAERGGREKNYEG